MGRSVSYPSNAKVITFKHIDSAYDCEECGAGTNTDTPDCEYCYGTGTVDDGMDFDMLIDDFRDHLKHLFPSVTTDDDWIGNEDHVLAENRLAQFGISEYCGLVAYWIVPKENGWYSDSQYVESFADRWIDSIADKFVAAFGELTKVGSMSNGEGVYRRIDR